MRWRWTAIAASCWIGSCSVGPGCPGARVPRAQVPRRHAGTGTWEVCRCQAPCGDRRKLAGASPHAGTGTGRLRQVFRNGPGGQFVAIFVDGVGFVAEEIVDGRGKARSAIQWADQVGVGSRPRAILCSGPARRLRSWPGRARCSIRWTAGSRFRNAGRGCSAGAPVAAVTARRRPAGSAPPPPAARPVRPGSAPSASGIWHAARRKNSRFR